jgi:hypothetical protein
VREEKSNVREEKRKGREETSSAREKRSSVTEERKTNEVDNIRLPERRMERVDSNSALVHALNEPWIVQRLFELFQVRNV